MEEENKNKKTIFHNPVLEAPWNFQGSNAGAGCTPRHVESPELFCIKELLESRMDEYNNFAIELKSKKNEVVDQIDKLNTRWTTAKFKSVQMKLNIERLTLNFPGLKKGQARAALQLSEDYEKAALLVQIVTCYKQLHLPAEKLQRHQTQFISNMFIENCKATISPLEGPFPTSIASAPITLFNTPGNSNDSYKSEDDAGRVGVVISKKGNGYTSSLIDE